MKDNTLMQIANVLSVNAQKLPSPGLLEGKMGVAIFLYHYARYSRKTTYGRLADYLIDEILKSIYRKQMSFSNGLPGIGWGIKYLIKEDFIDGKDHFLDRLNNHIIRYIKTHEDENMLDGCLYLTFSQPELLNDDLSPVFAKQFSLFLSSGVHPLATLNKLLAIVHHISNQHLQPWYDMLLNAAIDATHTQLFRHADLVICKELLDTLDEKKVFPLCKILHDRCMSILSANDFQSNLLETVWQRLVFFDRKDKNRCDFCRISTKITDILKDFNIQDMYLSRGLPAMGMEILLVTK